MMTKQTEYGLKHAGKNGFVLDFTIIRIVLAVVICTLSFAQAASQTAIKEYIYLGGRVLAVESGAASGGSFSASIGPVSRETQAGQSAEFTGTVAAIDGFAGNVNLSRMCWVEPSAMTRKTIR